MDALHQSSPTPALVLEGASVELAALATAEVDSVALDIIEVCITTVVSAGVISGSVALGVSEFGVGATRLVDGVDFSVALCATGTCVVNVTLVGDEDDIVAFAATWACVDAVVLVTDGMDIVVVDIFGACVAAVAPAVVWCLAVASGCAPMRKEAKSECQYEKGQPSSLQRAARQQFTHPMHPSRSEPPAATQLPPLVPIFKALAEPVKH
ncbi:hypothetical protein TSMEX_010568 [Taenia solium]|eukprot:TsM_000600300 transcript=TsM_000600300 gene=TsM_000600300